MATLPQILDAADSVAAFYNPQTIIIFGSYAYGEPTYDSDVDLLVVKEFRGSPNRQFDRIRSKIVFPFPTDLLVRTPGDVKRRIASNDFFLREIMERGIVLYAVDDNRMGQEGRRRLRRHLASPKIPQGEPARYDLLSLSAVR